MKRFFILLVLLGCATFLVPEVSSHVVVHDKSVGAVLHISPDDSPVAGEESTIIIEVNDKNDVFTPSDCECSISITENGKELYTTRLFSDTSVSSESTATITYTFPRKGVYAIQVIGKSLSSTFEQFELSYPVHVEREVVEKISTQDPTMLEKYWSVVVGILFLGGLVVAIAITRKKNKGR